MYKYIHAAIPAVLLHCCIGSVYCWSIYSSELSKIFETSKTEIDWGFGLIIFFLGMGSAFFGRITEKHPKTSAIVSLFLFIIGMITISISINIICLHLLYIGCSLMGAGTGIGYTAPIKTLMLWFNKNRGLACGISIAGFGLAKALASPFMVYLLSIMSVNNMFIVLAIIYGIIMSVSAILLKRYPYKIKNDDMNTDKIKKIVLSKEYISIWFMFFLNISCGLAIIGSEKQLISSIGLMMVGFLLSLTAIFNAGGRLSFATLSDHIGRKNIYYFISCIGIIGAILCLIFHPIIVVIGICMIEFAYGANFSCLAPYLSKLYGLNHASTTHSICLSAWGMAGLFGPFLGNILHGNQLYITIIVLYSIAGFLLLKNCRNVK